jgi:hypothetical protein
MKEGETMPSFSTTRSMTKRRLSVPMTHAAVSVSKVVTRSGGLRAGGLLSTELGIVQPKIEEGGPPRAKCQLPRTRWNSEVSGA